MTRSSGVLMHVTSLPGSESIGCFGKEARDFIDFLADSGFTWWQVLPFCMADECNSPYKSYSAFGGNPYLVDLRILTAEGYLTVDELATVKQDTPYVCEYGKLGLTRMNILRLAASRANDEDRAEIAKFAAENPYLEQFCEFMARRAANGDTPWYEWTKDEIDETEHFAWQFIQFHFMKQWNNIRAYAHEKGIRIMGDIPIYVAYDSCDVWANREQFQLDRDGKPTGVAGCPPDYFAEDGQFWGNPLYDWKRMKKDDYAWWSDRIRHMLTLFDGVRIDHFRGLESYWSIPATAKTAKEGKWEKGPGRALIDTLRAIAGDRLIIAEDLGDITPQVENLLRYSKFPGMRVMQFAFLGDPKSPHLPHNYPKNCVAYSGTHDNNTLLGYVWEMPPESRKRLLSYCNCPSAEWREACEQIVKTLMASHSDTVIFPIQDLFAYGSDTRMNTPGTAENNWAYRITRDQLAALDTSKLHFYNELYGRI